MWWCRVWWCLALVRRGLILGVQNDRPTIITGSQMKPRINPKRHQHNPAGAAGLWWCLSAWGFSAEKHHHNPAQNRKTPPQSGAVVSFQIGKGFDQRLRRPSHLEAEAVVVGVVVKVDVANVREHVAVTNVALEATAAAAARRRRPAPALLLLLLRVAIARGHRGGAREARRRVERWVESPRAPECLRAPRRDS